MGLRQDADLDLQRTYGAVVTTVDPRFAVDDVLTHGPVLDQTEGLLDLGDGWLPLRIAGQPGDGLLAQLIQAAIALLFDGNGVGLRDGLAEFGADGLEQRGVLDRRLPVPGRPTGLGGELLDGLDHRLEFFMSEQHGAEHLVLGQLFGLGLDHQHGGLGAGHHHVEAGSLSCS